MVLCLAAYTRLGAVYLQQATEFVWWVVGERSGFGLFTLWCDSPSEGCVGIIILAYYSCQ